ncbi:hypothetical protein Vretimale_4299 [Volvox reticuliferus]|uniref:Pterin-binding domain-containing protein n=1 Tax=Volvox reticuliferus TaxID=1737510 RepID=A0A8J4DGS7_9CHLO|nr:hypothetical protein Vretifemale_2870 [Volvox reticuliferus]GIL99004.1 hypothetical protein Vretimale_4299 [Volvox reticuliferus]
MTKTISLSYSAAMAKLAVIASVGERCYSTGAINHGTDVVIALGTNMGNRGLKLHQGLRRLRELGVQVLRHSALYETAAAYVTDQPSFLNAAVLARTHLSPGELLRALKQVEAEAGRDLAGGQRFGPRPLDLDIIFFGAGSYQDEKLTVPHPRWRERPFVQAPVSDLLYRRDTTAGIGGSQIKPQFEAQRIDSSSSSSSRGSTWSGSIWASGAQDGANSSSTSGGVNSTDFIDSCSQPLPTDNPRSVINHLRAVRDVWWESLRRNGNEHGDDNSSTSSGGAGGGVMRRVTPLVNVGSAGGSGGALLSWGRRTHLMGILNVTPDSFSDGGRHSGSVAAAVAAAEAMVSEGADILDVGGQSTRPGASKLTPQEELGRVMPVLRALRESPMLRSVPVSVDTFFSEVAREAVRAGGANIINDVSGGAADSAMLPTVAELGVPYILMHMRGDPVTMTRPEHTSYGTNGVWRTVGAEMQRSAEAAEAAGVPAWNIILDPGIGFSKTAEGNLDLLRNLASLRREALDGPYATRGPYNSDRSGSGGGGEEGGFRSRFGGPMLVGPSRKRFLGNLTGRQQPEDRDAATAAACVICVCGGADMVRVHAVRKAQDAVRVADAVYR